MLNHLFTVCPIEAFCAHAHSILIYSTVLADGLIYDSFRERVAAAATAKTYIKQI